MANDDLQISRGLSTHGFESELIFVGNAKDRRQLERMQGQATLDAIAQQVLERKHQLAKKLGQLSFDYSFKIFYEELVASEAMLKKAESLTTPAARKAFAAFVYNGWEQFGRFLERSDLECARGLLSVANRSPFPQEEEEQRGFWRRLFGD